MHPKQSKWYAAALVCGLPILLMVVYAFAMRLMYPFDLEWMEGGMLAHAYRVQTGQPLYAVPTSDWVPYIYPPGYPVLLAGIGIGGLDYFYGRAASIVGAVLAMVAAGSVVARAGGGWAKAWGPAVGAMLVFLGTYRASGAFFDLVRPDSISLALAGWSMYFALGDRRWQRLGAGVLLWFAFMFKHNYALFGVPMALAVWAKEDWRAALEFGLMAAVPAGLWTGWMQWQTDGNFLRYLIEVPSAHPSVLGRALPGASGELATVLPVAILGCGVAATLSIRRCFTELGKVALLPIAVITSLVLVWALMQPPVRGVPDPGTFFRLDWASLPAHPGAFFGALSHSLTYVGLGLFVGSLIVGGMATMASRTVNWRWITVMGISAVALFLGGLMRAHHGGFLNVLMPVHWVISIGFALSLLAFQSWGGQRGAAAGLLLLAVQLTGESAALRISDIIPTSEDVAAGEEVVERIRACEGPVFSPYAVWMPVQAGHEPGPHLIALWDIAHKDGPYYGQLKSIQADAKRGKWGCIVEGGKQSIGYGIERSYKRTHHFLFKKRVLMPRTGWRVRPTEILEYRGKR